MSEYVETSKPPVLSYASPRTDRSFGLRFLSLPPPGRVAAEIGVIALTMGVFGRHENTWWTSVYLATAVAILMIVRWIYRRLITPVRNDALNDRWWRLTAWLFWRCPRCRFASTSARTPSI